MSLQTYAFIFSLFGYSNYLPNHLYFIIQPPSLLFDAIVSFTDST